MFGLLGLPAFGLIIVGLYIGHAAAVVLCVALAIIYFVVLSLIQSRCKVFSKRLFISMRATRQRLPVLNRHAGGRAALQITSRIQLIASGFRLASTGKPVRFLRT